MTPPDPGTILETLRAEFPIDELLASRMVVAVVEPIETAETRETGAVVEGVETVEKKYVLHRNLNCGPMAVLGLRGAQTGEYFDVLTPSGLVATDEPSAFAAMREQHTLRSMPNWYPEEDPMLLVASDLHDVILLRSIGFPAALVDGFDKLGAAHVDDLCRLFNINRPAGGRDPNPQERHAPENAEAAETNDTPVSAPSSHAAPAPAAPTPDDEDELDEDDDDDDYEEEPDDEEPQEKDIRPVLTFVGWTPSTLDLAEPQNFKNACHTLADLEVDQRVDINAAAFWFVTPATVKKLSAACQSGTIIEVRRAVLESISENATDWLGLQAPARPPEAPIETLSAAFDQVQKVLSAAGTDSRDPLVKYGVQNRRDKALADYSRIVNRDCIGPVLVDVEATTDPVKKNLLMVVALKLQRYHQAVRDEYEQQANWRPAGRQGHWRPDPDHRKELLALEKDLMTTLKEYSKWNPPPLIIPSRRRPAPPVNTPRFAGWDWTNPN